MHKVSDRTFLLHLGGKISVQSKVPLRTRDDLSMAYTPGVGRVSMAIYNNPEDVRKLTIKGNSVAVVTDGSAVLGLGNIGPGAAMPVMEGKAALFKRFADIDAWPICLATRGHRRDREGGRDDRPGLRRHQPRGHRGPALLRDRAPAARVPRHPGLPRRPARHRDRGARRADQRAALRDQGPRLGPDRGLRGGRRRHGDRHAAARRGRPRRRGRRPRGCTVRRRRLALRAPTGELAAATNPRRATGSLQQVLVHADVFVGVSAPGILDAERIPTMAPKPVVFALANPDPEVDPAEAGKYAAVVASGRSDYPNQINNGWPSPASSAACSTRAPRTSPSTCCSAQRRRSPTRSAPRRSTRPSSSRASSTPT